MRDLVARYLAALDTHRDACAEKARTGRRAANARIVDFSGNHHHEAEYAAAIICEHVAARKLRRAEKVLRKAMEREA